MNIEKIKKELEKIIEYMSQIYVDFPYGACGRTSRLLAYVLEDRYDVNCISIISASLKKNPMQSHAWVVANGYIIDLTISQFNKTYNYNFPEIYISEDFSEYNKLFEYNCFNSKISMCEGEKEVDIKGYYEAYNYSFKQRVEVIIDFKGQDLGD